MGMGVDRMSTVVPLVWSDSTPYNSSAPRVSTYYITVIILEYHNSLIKTSLLNSERMLNMDMNEIISCLPANT